MSVARGLTGLLVTLVLQTAFSGDITHLARIEAYEILRGIEAYWLQRRAASSLKCWKGFNGRIQLVSVGCLDAITLAESCSTHPTSATNEDEEFDLGSILGC